MSQHLNDESLGELEQLMGAEFSLLISTYLRDANASLARLRHAQTQADAETLRRSAHSLKGGALNIGAAGLAELCANLELAASDGHLHCIPALLSEVEREMKAVQGELDNWASAS